MEINFKYTTKTSWNNQLKGLLVTALTFVICTQLNLKIDVHVGYFLVALSYFISTFFLSTSISKGLKKITIENNKIVLVYFSSFKAIVETDLDSITFFYKDDLVKFLKDGKVIGIAFKEYSDDINNWNIFVKTLRTISNS